MTDASRDNDEAGAAAPASSAASASSSSSSPENSDDESPATFPQLKAFLKDAQALGELRLIATNSAAVMESIAPLDKLFYASVPSRGEYANLIDAKVNLDLHLRLEGVHAVRFEQGVSRRAGASPTYVLRFLGRDKAGEREVVLSAFLSPVGECAPERVELWKQLRGKWCSDGAVEGSDSGEYVCSFVERAS